MTAITPDTSNPQAALQLDEPSFMQRRTLADWAFAALLLVATVVAFFRYQGAMDGYEQAILWGTMPAAIAMGWFWRPAANTMLGAGGLALLAIWLYQTPEGADLAKAEQVFLLKYFLSSQSAILWMCVLFFMSTAFYWLGMMLSKSADAMELLGSRLAWSAVILALVGTLVRWYEGHQMGPDIGHIPGATCTKCLCCFVG